MSWGCFRDKPTGALRNPKAVDTTLILSGYYTLSEAESPVMGSGLLPTSQGNAVS
jgi:hypothetical protein